VWTDQRSRCAEQAALNEAVAHVGSSSRATVFGENTDEGDHVARHFQLFGLSATGGELWRSPVQRARSRGWPDLSGSWQDMPLPDDVRNTSSVGEPRILRRSSGIMMIMSSTIGLPRTPWPRLHLFELCDQPWLPPALRNAETDYLAVAVSVGEVFDPLASKIGELMDRTDSDRIVDLASGGGGPWPRLAAVIGAARGGRVPEVTLTDRYPNQRAIARAADAGLAYAHDPIDARAVPASLVGVRTMFEGLHHLRPDEARAVLEDAHRARAPIVIGEALSRRIAVLITTVLIPVLVLVLTPRIRPRSAWQLLFTYVIPILPLVIAWDGLVSCLRTYRPAELLALTRDLDGHRWVAGHVRHRGATLTYLIGEPVSGDSTAGAPAPRRGRTG